MKKINILVITLLLSTLLLGCDMGSKLAPKGSVDQGTMKINPKSSPGYVGDVMPYYCDGEMNIYYLQDGRNTNLGFHPYALMTTTDYVNYTNKGVVIPFENQLDSPDFALGTGSIIKDSTGLYHAFYTGWNNRNDVGLPYFEKIQHATSNDKINWTKHPEDGFYGDSNDFRDPYVYLGEDNIYHMLVTTRKNNNAVICEYTSTNLTGWTYNGIFFTNDSGSYNMECPTFIKYNGYYYLSYSEQGSFRVTHYRYKKNLSDSWIKPEIDYLDGEGFYAGRMEKDENNLYMFGWCGTRVGEYDLGGYDWGGNLVVHKLTQNTDGTLKASMVDNIKNSINTEVSYKLSNGKNMSSKKFNINDRKAYMFEELSSNITRISIDAKISSLNGAFGLAFNTESDDSINKLALAFNFSAGYIEYFRNASLESLGSDDTKVKYNFEANSDLHIDIIIDGQIITAYVNNTRALSTRIYKMPNHNFSLFGLETDVNITNIKFYE